MEIFDYTVQDAKVLSLTSKSHTAGEPGSGIDPDYIIALDACIADAVFKGKAQEEAIKSVGALTEKQNLVIADALKLRTKLQNAGRTSYGDDNKQKMKELHVGYDVGSAVKTVSTELTYLAGVALRLQADLLKPGFKPADTAMFATLSTQLDANDGEQETAKKAQVNATAARNTSLKALQKTMKVIRGNAKVVFQNNEDILLQFEPISEGRAAAKKEEPTPSTGSSGAAPAVTGTTTVPPTK
jgi:hypothetical protein